MLAGTQGLHPLKRNGFCMKTPRYEFSKKQIKKNYQDISLKLPQCSIFYVVKANGDRNILRIMKEMGLGFKCESSYEFARVKEIGVDVSNIIFGSPIKTIDTIIDIYENGCRYFVFDDMRELHKLQKYAPESKKILHINISDFNISSTIYGMHISEINENIEELKMAVDGLSFYILNNNDFKSIQVIFDKIYNLMNKFSRTDKRYLVNIGGGYKIDNDNEYYYKYNVLLTEVQRIYRCKYYAESGENLIASAGNFFAKIIALKQYDNKCVAYIDGGIPNGIGFTTFIGTVENYSRNTFKKDKEILYEFRDCTNLNESCIITKHSYELEIGDIIKFTNCGAYTVPYQNDFHLWEKCRVHIVK